MWQCRLKTAGIIQIKIEVGSPIENIAKFRDVASVLFINEHLGGANIGKGDIRQTRRNELQFRLQIGRLPIITHQLHEGFGSIRGVARRWGHEFGDGEFFAAGEKFLFVGFDGVTVTAMRQKEDEAEDEKKNENQQDF